MFYGAKGLIRLLQQTTKDNFTSGSNFTRAYLNEILFVYCWLVGKKVLLSLRGRRRFINTLLGLA